MTFGTSYGPYDYDVWLIGTCGIYNDIHANITLYIGSTAITLYVYYPHSSSGENPITNYVPVCIPISSKLSRSVRIENGGYDDEGSFIDINIYRCI